MNAHESTLEKVDNMVELVHVIAQESLDCKKHRSDRFREEVPAPKPSVAAKSAATPQQRDKRKRKREADDNDNQLRAKKSKEDIDERKQRYNALRDRYKKK